MNDKDLKYRIRLLRKIKKATDIGTAERRSINKKIRELKSKVNSNYNNCNKELINKIYKLRPEYKSLGIDLRKFTEKQLKIHLDKLTGGKK